MTGKFCEKVVCRQATMAMQTALMSLGIWFDIEYIASPVPCKSELVITASPTSLIEYFAVRGVFATGGIAS